MNFLLNLILYVIRGPVCKLHNWFAQKAEIAGKKDDPSTKFVLGVLGDGSPTEDDLKLLVAIGMVFFVAIIVIAAYGWFIIDHIVRFGFRLIR